MNDKPNGQIHEPTGVTIIMHSRLDLPDWNTEFINGDLSCGLTEIACID